MMMVSILREYLPLNDQGECNRHKRSGRFNIRKGVFNLIYFNYLVHYAWGFSNSYLFEMEKIMKNILLSFYADTSGSKNDDVMLFLIPSMDNMAMGISLSLGW